MTEAIISALFVETNGPYFNDKRIDPWDVSRDAFNYSGPNAVIVHPPCQKWGSMAFVNHARWGGEHNIPGNDGGCFEFALSTLEKFGGVLEHPKNSRAFAKYGIRKPRRGVWLEHRKGWVTEVFQSAYGHRANKGTWLYYVGDIKPFNLKWGKVVGDYQVGGHDQRGKERNKPTLSKKEALATPVEFKEILISLAMLSRDKS